MAAEIDFTTGKPAIVYTGDEPWHGYGTKLTGDEDLDTWRVAAGLDWEVERRPVFYHNGYGFKEYPKREVLTRSDTKDALSIVSDRFKIVQPRDAVEFFREAIRDMGFKMSTAGSLRGGRRIWAMADVGEAFHAHNLGLGRDRVGAHLLLATAYDGTFSTTAQFTSIRVVCNNTLGFSLDRGGEGGIVRIPHNQEFFPQAVKAELGFDASWAQFRENVYELAQHKVTQRDAIEYFLYVMGVTEEEAADGKQLSNVKKLISLYESGPGAELPSAKNTLWGAVNAVTFLADHCRAAKNTGNRFDSASFGSGAALKRRAYTRAVEIAEAA
jgi:phage/plasmid-like protein (TIGR03299 family)